MKIAHGLIPLSLLKDLTREQKNLIRKHWEGCAASVNGDSLRDGGLGGFFHSFFVCLAYLIFFFSVSCVIVKYSGNLK